MIVSFFFFSPCPFFLYYPFPFPLHNFKVSFPIFFSSYLSYFFLFFSSSFLSFSFPSLLSFSSLFPFFLFFTCRIIIYCNYYYKKNLSLTSPSLLFLLCPSTLGVLVCLSSCSCPHSATINSKSQDSCITIS